jgi:glycerol-3-phosphate acyltransferase PlsY
MNFLYISLAFIVSYIIGSFPTAYFVVKRVTGKDIRKEGTGNVGAMNTVRATGKIYLFIIVYLIDALKGVLAIFLARLLSNFGISFVNLVTAAGFGAVLGHCFSLYFKIKFGKFSGGKAVATFSGIFIALNFKTLLIPWVLSMVISIILSGGNLFLGQFTGALLITLIAYFFDKQYLLMCFLIAIPVLIRQWPRVLPMLKGKEPKWYWNNKKHEKK